MLSQDANMFIRIAAIITPVVLIILVGWLYGRKAHPDMSGINRATLDVIAPLLVVSAFVSKDFELLDQWNLLLCGVAVVLGSGILAWPIAKISGIDPKTFVPPMMFNNCGNMGLPLAVFAFGTADLGMIAGHYLHAYRQSNRYANRGSKFWNQAWNLDVKYYDFISNF